MGSPMPEIETQDLELIDRVARKVVEYHAELPAVLTLEGSRPLSLIAGQTMTFFEPIVSAFLRLPDYRRFATLIERREAIEALIRAIETRADAAHAARTEARRAARAERRPHTVRPPRT
jgi:hypothetical protein